MAAQGYNHTRPRTALATCPHASAVHCERQLVAEDFVSKKKKSPIAEVDTDEGIERQSKHGAINNIKGCAIITRAFYEHFVACPRQEREREAREVVGGKARQVHDRYRTLRLTHAASPTHAAEGERHEDEEEEVEEEEE